jgi:transposase
MTRRSRRKHASAFRAKVAMAAVRGDKTPAELAQQFDIHVNRITQWKAQILDGAAGGVQPETPGSSCRTPASATKPITATPSPPDRAKSG